MSRVHCEFLLVTFYMPLSEANIIAIDPQSNTLFKTLSQMDLSLCHCSGGKYY